jgi:hypothetical protein
MRPQVFPTSRRFDSFRCLPSIFQLGRTRGVRALGGFTSLVADIVATNIKSGCFFQKNPPFDRSYDRVSSLLSKGDMPNKLRRKAKDWTFASTPSFEVACPS